jgi:hypothetical protein
MNNRLIIVFAIFFFPFFSFSQHRINRYKHSKRHGTWIVYQDSTNTKVDNIGRYRKGIPKGTWKYYDSDGRLIKKEKNRFRKIYTTYYHQNGRIKKKGKAMIVIDDKLIHYFYYGNWFVYDSTGQLLKKQVYANGNKISELNYKTSSESGINDSLTEVVKKLNTQLSLYLDSLQIAENKFGKNSEQYQRYVSLNNLNALKVLSDVDMIINKFGYPGKKLVGKEYAIVFSIISSAALKYKLKHYDDIIEAANQGELDWSDVAFFVDKVKVAQKQGQIYGTQYKIIGNTLSYYPIADKENLNERRKKIGLDEATLSLIIDNAAY